MARTGKPYRLSRQAEADLEDIFAYTAKTWSIRPAERHLDDVQDAIEALAAGRRSGRSRPELGAAYLVRSLGSHLIIFREAEEIFVVRLLHRSQDLAQRLGAGRS